MNRKVSVIIPMYNSEEVIIRAIQSVLNQTVQVDELLIIDDGSKDNSVNTVREFFKDKSHQKIKLLTKANGGASSARNLGIRSANNDIIAFLDSDDEWVSDKLELQLPYILAPDVALVGGNHFSKKVNSILWKKAKNVNEVTLRDLLFKNYFQTSTVITRKSLALRFGGFDEMQKYAEEGQFYYNISKYGRMVHLNKQLVIYDGGEKSGFGESGLSANVTEMEVGELKNLKYAYSKLNVSFFLYLWASLFSILKYFRRLLLVRFKR